MFHSEYPKMLFWISDIIILDIQNKVFHQLYIFIFQKYLFLDSQNYYFEYPKNGINVNSSCHTCASTDRMSLLTTAVLVHSLENDQSATLVYQITMGLNI